MPRIMDLCCARSLGTARSSGFTWRCKIWAHETVGISGLQVLVGWGLDVRFIFEFCMLDKATA